MGWTRFLRRARWDDERARELQSYLDIETDANIARGMTPDDARAAAHRKLGNVTLVREEIYRMNSIAFVDGLWQDLRYGARLLRLNPGFALVALLSLALGIGANTAIFQAVDAVRLRTLPVKDPDGLVQILIGKAEGGRTGSFSGSYPGLTYAQWEEIRTHQQAFASLLAWGTTQFNLSEGGESRFARGLWVSGDFFSTLGVQPAAGRLLTPADDDQRACGAPSAVVSYPFWEAELGGDPSAVGRTLRLDGHPVDIVGVAPPGFFGLDVGSSFDVAVPLCGQTAIRPGQQVLDRRDFWWLAAFGRLKPGWTIDRASAHLSALSPGIFEATAPSNYRPEDAKNYLAFELQALPAGTGVSTLREEYGTSLWLLLSIAGLVLLIACANLANLMLARASARGREIAIRLAIGASRARIVRQLMAESLLLSGLGAAAGAWLAARLSRSLVSFIATGTDPLFVDLHLDWRVLAFAIGLAAVTSIIFGLTPALRATRTSPATMMRATGPGLTESRERVSLRHALVVAQMAVSLVLVAGALLFARTLVNLTTLDPGFRQDVLVASLDLRRTGVADAQVAALHRRILERLRALPDTAAAGVSDRIPISRRFWNETLVIDGTTQQDFPWVTRVGAGFFGTLGVGFVAGRNFDDRDGLAAPLVAVVNEAFAQKYFAGRVPLGRAFQFAVGPGQPSPSYEIVGVVKDTKYDDMRAPFAPIIFVPATQDPEPGSLTVLMRGRRDAASLATPVTQALATIDPRILIRFQMLDAQIRDTLVRERLMATLSGFFAAMAVLLAAIGLYGVVSYTVARRRTEIGIRLALGAGRGRIVRLVANETVWLVGIGSAIGLALAVLAARTAASLLFGVTPGDPATLAVAVLVLAGIALAASLLPAYRAARLDPTATLREP